MTRLPVVVLLVLVTVSYCAGQTPHFRKHLLPLEYKGAGINCLIQDQQKFIWLGTTAGLVKFDGTHFEYFRQFPSTENHVVALFEASNGVLWVGYKDGRIGQFRDHMFSHADSIPSNSSSPVTGFCEDNAGRVWAGTYGGGLIIFDKNNLRTLRTTDGLSDDFVYSIVAINGSVFAGTDKGISVCRILEENTEVRVLSAENGIRDNIITALAADQRGRLWAGSESGGIARYDSTSGQFQYPFPSWAFGRVTSMIVEDESAWVGTSMKGIIEANLDGEFVNPLVGADRSLPLRITDLAKDNEGNLWLASGTGVLFSGHALFSFVRSDEKGNGNIQAILYTKEGKLMYSNPDGVFVTKPNSASPERLVIPGFDGAQVISLYEDAYGFIWMGTFDRGVLRYDSKKGSGRIFRESEGLVNDNVLSIAGTANTIWFATLGGVSMCEINENTFIPSFKNYTTESGLGSNYIYKIFVDSKERIWFATDGKGVSVLDNGSFTNYSLNEGLRSSIVYSVTEDAFGEIWVSTSNAGIYRFNGSAFQAFSPHNGLRDLAIASIIGEKNGSILIVSKEGIDVLDPRSGTVFYHGQEFGISGIDPNLNAYTRDEKGNVWLGTQSGIIRYNTNLAPLPRWPVTRINEMQVFLNPVDGDLQTLSHDNNHVSFDYIGFWYHDPSEVSYRIKLEGYDREWINSKNTFVTYPNLPAGHYRFLVQSSATNHFEGAITKSYSFTIAPPFYNTIWFYVVATLSLVAIGYVLLKRREKRIRVRERIEKEKIEFQFETLKNQVNPHFLFNSFNTLVGVIEEDKDIAVEYVIKLSEFYRDILVNREKDVIRLDKELELIDNYYFLQKKRYKDNFRLVISVPQIKTQLNIPPLTLQLLVENAIKHNIISREKPLEVKIHVDGDYLVVENNLQPKILHEPSTGTGLNNIIGRFRLLTEKQVQVEKSTTTFSVRVPLLNS